MINLKKIGAVVLSSAMALSMLTACGGGSSDSSSDSAPAEGEKVLNFGCYKYSDNMDPAINQNSAWDAMRLGVTEGLFKFDAEVVPQPQLCDEIVSKSDDMTEFVYHIRDGVKFSNGDACDAQAVADSLTRLYNVTSSDNAIYETTATSYADIASVTADKDANTITIKLNTPNYNLEGALCFPYYAIIDVQGDVTDENHKGDDSGKIAGYAPTELIGTGPYVMESYDVTTSCGSLTANENYWKEEVPFDKVNFTHIAEADKKAMSLQNGEIDLTENITTTADLDALKDNDDYYVSQCVGVRTGFGYMNFKGILKNDALRQAILTAIDGQTMCDVTVGGMYTYGPQVLPVSTSFDASKLNNPYAFNAEKAKKILDDAGIKDTDGDGIVELDGKPVEINFVTYVNRCLDTFAEACEPAISGLGIKCNIVVTDDQKIWDDYLVPGNFDILNNNWTTMGVGDPVPFLKNWLGGDAANYNGYQNDNFDKALKELETEADPAKREELVLSLEQQLLDDAAVLVHGYYNSNMVSNKAKVTGAEINTIDYYWLSTDIKPAQ